MNFLLCGDKNAPPVLLIHGMATDAESCYGTIARKLAKRYRVIMACLDGHDPYQISTFESISVCCEKIERYIGKRFGGSVYAVSGRQWNDIPRQADKLLEEHGDSVDAILIFIGTNDYNNGVPIGEWYDVKDEQVMYGHGEPKKLVNRQRRYMKMDPETYRGRINIALDKVKRMFPGKQIILLTPIHRAQFHRSEKNWQITEDYTNQCGIYLEEYINAVKDAGNIWAVPVIDMNALSGLYPMMDEHAQYFKDADTDRLHPNDKGHERLARTLYYQLSTLPCVLP